LVTGGYLSLVPKKGLTPVTTHLSVLPTKARILCLDSL
jgi:hypothetical protein